MKFSGKAQEIHLKEYDADANSENGLKIKLILLTDSGKSEVHYLTPSGNDEYKEHTISIKTTEKIDSIAMYPVRENDYVDDFGGVWNINNLHVRY